MEAGWLAGKVFLYIRIILLNVYQNIRFPFRPQSYQTPVVSVEPLPSGSPAGISSGARLFCVASIRVRYNSSAQKGHTMVQEYARSKSMGQYDILSYHIIMNLSNSCKRPR